MTSHTIIIVEDEQEARERLVKLINAHENFELLNDAASVADGMAALIKYKPDILLTDLGLPDGSGIEIIQAIDKNHLDCEAMVISGFQDEHNVFKALEAGAKSYIHKQDKNQKITDAILTMIAGGAPISPVIARMMLQKFKAAEAVPLPLPEALTQRQIKILKLVSQGFSSKEIAAQLSISYYTVTTHIKNIYSKLQVNSRTEALNLAKLHGLL